MPSIIVYATQTCPYCLNARRLLDAKGVSYELIDVTGKPDLWAEMEAKTGRHTVPQIYIGEHHVGGFDDLSAADRSGQLDTLLNPA